MSKENLNENVEESMKYFEQASLSGYAYAYNNIGLIHEKNNNYKEALKNFKLSADLNGDGRISVADFGMVKAHLLGKRIIER